MINFFRRAIDRSMFLWWLNLNSSSSLKIIGGDSNLPEKKLIIKSLQHHEIIMYMLEIKGDWISQKEVEDVTDLIYKKFAPFNKTPNQSKMNVKFSRQSFLSLLAIYNLCNIGINSRSLNKNKLKFKLSESLSEAELELLTRIHRKLSLIFNRVFNDAESKFSSELQTVKEPMFAFENLLLTLMLGCLMGSFALFFALQQPMVAATLLCLSLLIFIYFYLTRTKAIAAAFEKSIIHKLRKHKGI